MALVSAGSPESGTTAPQRRPRVWLIAVLCLALLGVAVGCGIIFAPIHGYVGAIAVALCGLPAMATVTLTLKLARTHQFGGLIGMVVGLFVRLAIAVGVGAAIFLLVPDFKAWKFGYWAWVMGVYLVVLVVETAVLAKAITTVAPAVKV